MQPSRVSSHKDHLSPQQQAFLEYFEQISRMFLALYFGQDDPPEPSSFLWSPDFMDGLFSFMPEEFNAIVNQLREYSDVTREFRREFNAVEGELRDAIGEWFELAGFDYENIPPPPSDVQMVKVKGGFKDHKTAYQFGQVIWVGSSSRTHGWSELYRVSDGKRICSFHPQTSGICWNKETTETVWQIARELANLTDWDIVGSQPIKVQRAIRRRVIEIAEPLRSYFRIN